MVEKNVFYFSNMNEVYYLIDTNKYNNKNSSISLSVFIDVFYCFIVSGLTLWIQNSDKIIKDLKHQLSINEKPELAVRFGS
jgi:hypothetical protein